MATETPPDARPKSRPRKRQRTLSQAGMTGEAETAEVQGDGGKGSDGELEGAGDSSSAGRACENCRRSKLRCSRTQPCAKCVLKRISCVYEESAKGRGPRPGYIEELNSRMDTLEKLVLGQSLLLDGNTTIGHATRGSVSTTTLQSALWDERARLLELAESGEAFQPHQQQQARQRQPSLQDPPLPPAASDNASPSRGFHAPLSPLAIRSGGTKSVACLSDVIHAQALSPSHDVLRQVTDFYEQHIQSWLPIMPWSELNPRLESYDPVKPIDPWLQAILAAGSPYVAAVAHDQARYFEELKLSSTQRLFHSADMDEMRRALVLHFLLLGKGRVTEIWGISMYLMQIVVRAGLHVEDHHVTREQLTYRRLLKFDGRGQSWPDKESLRRLFWAVFLMDRFACIFSGVQPCLNAREIRRVLPCPGKYWQNREPMHTRDFVAASIAVQVQLYSDMNLGGYAYLLEATDILTMVAIFATKSRGSTSSRLDAHAFLKEFLELDLILTNWKSELPPQFHHASYDEDGYMDHNLTLALMTHNTSSILLYQSPRALHGAGSSGDLLHRTLLPQCAIIKYGAKEIAKICTRFLFHRRYLVSPQFVYCQFSAARALLAYSSWTMEPVDEAFETLFTALAESAKRWTGGGLDDRSTVEVSSLSNLASMLHSRLSYDIKHPESIDLAVPIEELLREAGIASDSLESGTEQFGVSPRHGPGLPPVPVAESDSCPREVAAHVYQQSDTAGGVLQSMVADISEQHDEARHPEQLDGVLAQMSLSQPDFLNARLFTWETEANEPAAVE